MFYNIETFKIKQLMLWSSQHRLRGFSSAYEGGLVFLNLRSQKVFELHFSLGWCGSFSTRGVSQKLWFLSPI